MLVLMHHLLYVNSFWNMMSNKYYQVDHMKQLFQDVYVNNIMMFLKEINLLPKYNYVNS